MSLPQNLSLNQMANTWATQLDPIIANPMTNPTILKSIKLATGTNSINHLLSRNLQGWTISRIRASATIYDTQDTNPMPSLTLQLVASAPVVVDLVVW